MYFLRIQIIQQTIIRYQIFGITLMKHLGP